MIEKRDECFRPQGPILATYIPRYEISQCWNYGVCIYGIESRNCFVFILCFVRIVSPVSGILLRIPALCRTENLPKLLSFNVNPSICGLFSGVDSSAVTIASTTLSASLLVGNLPTTATVSMLISRIFDRQRMTS